jgi:hypothetical protein
MSGYEIQNLKYKTFEGEEADAIDLFLVKKPQQQNGFSLLQRDFEQEEFQV